MQVMQYAITLPADYDMRIVRHRVSRRATRRRLSRGARNS